MKKEELVKENEQRGSSVSHHLVSTLVEKEEVAEATMDRGGKGKEGEELAQGDGTRALDSHPITHKVA